MTRYIGLLFQLFFYLDIISAHNILRLEDTRLAKFILRHTDKVHVTSHYKEFYTQEEAACVDRCVTETECKSVNFYKDETDLEKSKCQLVDEDIDDQNEYVTRAGWRHLDTGKSSITRLKHPDGYCYAPIGANECDFTTSNIELHPISSLKCTSVSAYFDFDRSWAGVITHVCSGKILCPSSDTTGPIQLVDIQDCPYSAMDLDERKKFRRNPRGFLEWGVHQCVGPYGGNIAPEWYMVLTSSCTARAAQIVFDFDKGPIKVSIFQSMGTLSFNNFENAIRAKQDSPTLITYMDNFFHRTKTWDQHGMRWESVFQARSTGEYKFYLMANDFAKLYMGKDETETSKNYCTGSTGNSGLNDEFSCTRYLVKGAKYYIELLTYDDNLYDWQYLKVDKPNFEEVRAISYEDLELPANDL
ncbi:uncharacterized protein [Clytia hemisphaerica]|uniref:uncharacterized protein n=1 Tax=Clytia hemisphaerica TaxID=252671 RepID=UPI0034D430C4